MTSDPPGSLCIYCGELLDAATGMGHDAPPSPGDITVCAYCGALLAFNQDLGLRALTSEEQALAAGNEALRQAQAIVAELIKARKPRANRGFCI